MIVNKQFKLFTTITLATLIILPFNIMGTNHKDISTMKCYAAERKVQQSPSINGESMIKDKVGDDPIYVPDKEITFNEENEKAKDAKDIIMKSEADGEITESITISETGKPPSLHVLNKDIEQEQAVQKMSFVNLLFMFLIMILIGLSAVIKIRGNDNTKSK